jgi:hypothetical protein
MDAAGSLDERGNVRRMSKFVAYVNRFDEAKAIGAGGMNVKLAAALCGCFIMVERHEETAFEKFASRGGDTRAEERWAEDDADRWSDAREDDDWLASPDESFSPLAKNANEMRAPIDLEDDGLDELGWPDLDVEGISGVGPSALYDPRSDEANWEEVGPGKVGVVTFGGNLGAGIAGGCSFMGDPEDAEAERLGDAAEAAMASGAGAAFQPSEENDESLPHRRAVLLGRRGRRGRRGPVRGRRLVRRGLEPVTAFGRLNRSTANVARAGSFRALESTTVIKRQKTFAPASYTLTHLRREEPEDVFRERLGGDLLREQVLDRSALPPQRFRDNRKLLVRHRLAARLEHL